MNNQRTIERRIYEMHLVIADRLKADPRLLQIARSNLNRWREQSGDKPWMREWERILDSGVLTILSILRDPGETATRLRSSSPFVGILNERERGAFYSTEFLRRLEREEHAGGRAVEVPR